MPTGKCALPVIRRHTISIFIYLSWIPEIPIAFAETRIFAGSPRCLEPLMLHGKRSTTHIFTGYNG